MALLKFEKHYPTLKMQTESTLNTHLVFLILVRYFYFSRCFIVFVFVSRALGHNDLKAEVGSQHGTNTILCHVFGFCLFVCCFLGLHLQHMEVPRLGVELEL